MSAVFAWLIGTAMGRRVGVAVLVLLIIVGAIGMYGRRKYVEGLAAERAAGIEEGAKKMEARQAEAFKQIQQARESNEAVLAELEQTQAEWERQRQAMSAASRRALEEIRAENSKNRLSVDQRSADSLDVGMRELLSILRAGDARFNAIQRDIDAAKRPSE